MNNLANLFFLIFLCTPYYFIHSIEHLNEILLYLLFNSQLIHRQCEGKEILLKPNLSLCSISYDDLKCKRTRFAIKQRFFMMERMVWKHFLTKWVYVTHTQDSEDWRLLDCSNLNFIFELAEKSLDYVFIRWKNVENNLIQTFQMLLLSSHNFRTEMLFHETDSVLRKNAVNKLQNVQGNKK